MLNKSALASRKEGKEGTIKIVGKKLSERQAAK